jgi:hypothetical protein
MNEIQILTIALSTVPTMLTVLVGILVNNARLNGMSQGFTELRARMDSRFDALNHHFDELNNMCRSELHRVEEVLDARLKHLEGR